jgi:hypothetical protein
MSVFHVGSIPGSSAENDLVSTRADGSTYVQVLYRLNGKQSSISFERLI